MKVKDMLKALWKRFKELLRGFLNEDVPTPTPTPEKPTEPVVEPPKPIPTPVPPPPVVEPPKPAPVEPVPQKPPVSSPPQEIPRGRNSRPESSDVLDKEFTHYTYWMVDGQDKLLLVKVPEGKKGFQLLSMPTPILGRPDKEDTDYIVCSLRAGRTSIGSGRWDFVGTGDVVVSVRTEGYTGGVNFNVLWK